MRFPEGTAAAEEPRSRNRRRRKRPAGLTNGVDSTLKSGPDSRRIRSLNSKCAHVRFVDGGRVRCLGIARGPVRPARRRRPDAHPGHETREDRRAQPGCVTGARHRQRFTARSPDLSRRLPRSSRLWVRPDRRFQGERPAVDRARSPEDDHSPRAVVACVACPELDLSPTPFLEDHCRATWFRRAFRLRTDGPDERVPEDR
jgi:hypothetical protein